MNLRNLAIIILIVAGGLMTFLIYDINSTEKSLAHSLIEKPMESAEVHLDGFFEPVENILKTSRDHGSFGYFDTATSAKMNTYFTPLIKNFPQLSSMGLANTSGYEYDVLPGDATWQHRVVWIDGWGDVEKWSSWKYDSITHEWSNIKSWEDVVKHDPRVRPWFTGALEKSRNKVNWTEPYVYNTTFEIGMTASVRWHRPEDSLKYIMAFDLTLADVSAFTQNLKVSKNGKVFVLSDKDEYIGLPRDELLSSNESIQSSVLKHPDSVDIPEVKDALKSWKDSNRSNEAFEFKTEGEYWWGKLIRYNIADDRHFTVGVIIPEKDILSKVQQTKRIIIGSFIFVLILTGFVLYSYGQTRKANVALSAKNVEITKQRDEITKQHEEIFNQKLLIEEQHQDILGSIAYAKRLQDAILPQRNEFKKYFPESFIFYMPKDVVAGDFYWMEKVDDIIYFAAADCTGHGVPGAMVSFVCSNALSKALIEEKIQDVGKLLDRTRDLVIDRFGKSDEEIRDGMDISLCAINLKTNTMQWAGANNPLWILRKGANEVEEIKADKQPIGKYGKAQPFTSHQIKLEKGDSFYIFSDGFPDQFGGDNGKKYKSKTFKNFLVSVQDKSMEDQLSEVGKEFQNWRGDFEQIDDVCVIGVRV
ncbi:MAG: SpoIIE family protein phosphatase [Crocinitomicaceae bacterium]|nr:SpoIIE family protein phosphatase [Crocinitomicaceae bacterium]